MNRLSASVAVVALLWMSLAGTGQTRAEETPIRSVHSQPSAILATKSVELAITKRGAHMAPVTFFRETERPIRPYYVSPWQDEPATAMPAPVLNTLRGDFFCMPFGGNSEAVNGESHPPHGEIAGNDWEIGETRRIGDVATLTIKAVTGIRPGTVTRELSLVEGQSVVYSRTRIEGFSGRVPLGHHATLAMPDESGAVRIATSPIRFGMTCPGLFSDPKNREYQALLPGARWTDLTRVPSAWKNEPDSDLTRLPGRFGYADLVQIVNDPEASALGWMAATFPQGGYVWFSLKDPTQLKSTVFWMENHGRHGHPWNGRNNCLGLEDVTAFFAEGLAASVRPNVLTEAGVETAVELHRDRPTVVNYIQGVARIPAGFENVRTIEFSPRKITLVSTTGQKVDVDVRHEFIKSGALASP